MRAPGKRPTPVSAKVKGAECSDICVVNDCLSTQDAYDSTKKFVADGTEFNGVFTTDEFAIGVVKALHELDIEAVETLVAMIRTNKGGHGIKKVIRPSLIRRESTA